jgi:hypothetical protein
MALVMLVMVVHAFTAQWSFVLTQDGLSVGFFPRVAATATLLVALALVVVPGSSRPAALDRLTRAGLGLAGLGFVSAAAYSVLLLKAGYLLVTPLFLTGGMFVLGVRPWTQAALYGVVAALTILAMFALLGFPLPGLGG